MSLIAFFCVILPILFINHGQGLDECQEQRCGSSGPPIRFPFRLNHQPAHCGYPGFDLSCSDKHKTMLKLPNSVELVITKIDYVSQMMITSDPENCLPRKALNFNLHASPFRFQDWLKYDFVLFNCTSIYRGLFTPVPCLNVFGYDVYYFDSLILLSDLPLGSCTKMYNISLVPEELFSSNDLLLNWTNPDCGYCESQKKHCRFSDYGRGPGIECFDPPKDLKALKKKLMIAGICIGSFLLLVAVGVLHHLYSSDKKEKENQARIENFLEDYKAMKPTRYLYADLKRITNNFKHKLGQGANGTVYKGRLSNDIFVAVKILSSSTSTGEEFINEVGTIGRIHHINVVRLVGFCADGFRRALVYEFLPNESLERLIFLENGKHKLGWDKLQEIGIGIAKGIEYLHQGCDQMILHFDIKPHNILLDANFTPKISDFGLAKLCAKDQSAVSMTAARGTMGYIAPEVFSRNFGNVSYKSDVYSYGMLLLEMVGGRKNTDTNVEKMSQVYFPKWVYKHLDQREELGIQIEAEEDTEIARKLAIVGLWCIQWYPANRPSMKTVVQMLEEEAEKLTLPPNPFASTDSRATKGAGVNRRDQQLEIIPEME